MEWKKEDMFFNKWKILELTDCSGIRTKEKTHFGMCCYWKIIHFVVITVIPLYFGFYHTKPIGDYFPVT